MNKLLRILGSLVLAVTLLFAGAVLYFTMKGYLAWYFRVNGDVTVDGRNTSGYMNANTDQTILLITRTDGSRPETYLVSLGEEEAVLDCGDWHPIRFFSVSGQARQFTLQRLHRRPGERH